MKTVTGVTLQSESKSLMFIQQLGLLGEGVATLIMTGQTGQTDLVLYGQGEHELKRASITYLVFS